MSDLPQEKTFMEELPVDPLAQIADFPLPTLDEARARYPLWSPAKDSDLTKKPSPEQEEALHLVVLEVPVWPPLWLMATGALVGSFVGALVARAVATP